MSRRSMVEQLESRQMLTVSSVFDTGVLTITAGDGNDQIVVTSDNGNVKINGSDPSGGILSAIDVTNITAYGSKDGNLIDLRGVDGAFSALVNVVIRGEDSDAENANDTIYGAPN